MNREWGGPQIILQANRAMDNARSVSGSARASRKRRICRRSQFTPPITCRCWLSSLCRADLRQPRHSMGWNLTRLPRRSHDTDPLHLLQMGPRDPLQEQICSNNLGTEPGRAWKSPKMARSRCDWRCIDGKCDFRAFCEVATEPIAGRGSLLLTFSSLASISTSARKCPYIIE